MAQIDIIDFRLDFPPCCHEKVDLSPEKMDELLNGSVHSGLLLSVKDHLRSLCLSLRLLDKKRCPTPDFDWILRTVLSLKEILETLDQTLGYIEPEDLTDSMSKRADRKHFKYSRLHNIICALLAYELRNLIQSYGGAIENYDPSSFPPENLHEDYWPELPRLSREFAHCGNLIDSVIKWSQQSDFAILRKAWLDTEESLNKRLEATTSLIKFGRWPDQLKKSLGPFVKLIRIFLKQLLRITTNNYPIKLDPEMDCETLNLLDRLPDSLLKIHPFNRHNDHCLTRIVFPYRTCPPLP